jgi:hypothetical protein
MRRSENSQTIFLTRVPMPIAFDCSGMIETSVTMTTQLLRGISGAVEQIL